MSTDLLHWWKIGGSFGAGAGFLAMLGSCLGMFLPSQPVEKRLEAVNNQHRKVMSDVVLAQAESGELDGMFSSLNDVLNPELKAELIGEVAAQLEEAEHITRLVQIAKSTSSEESRAVALTSIARRQSELGFDSATTLVDAQSAAIAFVNREPSLRNRIAYKFGANRNAWPLLFAATGSTLMLIMGLLSWRRPKLFRRRGRRIGFS